VFRNKKDKMKIITLMVAACVFGIVPSYGSAVTVTLLGTAGINDGNDYVLPYNLVVDGQTIDAACYDFFDNVSIGQSWQANEFYLSEAATVGMFSQVAGSYEGYKLIGALYSIAVPTDQNKIDVQHVIWNVFDPGTFTSNTEMNAYMTQALVSESVLDYSSIVYIEGVTGTHVQGFVTHVTPEPSYILTTCFVFFISVRKKLYK
jgi:hypothetical protein